jgi:Bacterial PH domain
VGQPQTFRSPTAVVVWVVWLLFAVGNWIDLAVQGRDHASAVAAAVLLLATGVAYVFAQRPRIIADDAGLTIRNPLRDHRIGWAGVAEVDVVDLLRVHCDGGVPGDKEEQKVIGAWAVHYSRRRQLAAEARARRAARPRRAGLGFPSAGRGLSYGADPVTQENSPEAEAEKVVRLLSERATAARAEAVWSGGTGPATSTATAAAPTGSTRTTAPAELLSSTWNSRAIAALVIPALTVLIVWLL